MNKTSVSLPDIRKLKYVTSYAQLRPYRQGGYRIQKQVIAHKNIYHNYGHAGSGVSLSYGSAQKIVDIFQTQVNSKNNNCAVLGSGILGLLTAFQLKNRGQKVKIYTKKIPSYGQKENKLMITSQIAPGFWFPYDYLDNQALKLDEIAKITMDFLKKSIQTNRYRALKYCETYDQIYLKEVIKRFENLFPGKSREMQIDFGNGSYQQFNCFTTVKIDMQLWLKQIIVELVRGGVQFIPKQFHQLKQVLSLNQKYIFNCTGYGSKYLFNDQNMKAYRGHIVQFQNPNPQLYNYIFGARLNNNIVRIYAHHSRILIGLTKQQNQHIQVDSAIVKKLIDNYIQYFLTWTQLPSAKL